MIFDCALLPALSLAFQLSWDCPSSTNTKQRLSPHCERHWAWKLWVGGCRLCFTADDKKRVNSSVDILFMFTNSWTRKRHTTTISCWLMSLHNDCHTLEYYIVFYMQTHAHSWSQLVGSLLFYKSWEYLQNYFIRWWFLESRVNVCRMGEKFFFIRVKQT